MHDAGRIRVRLRGELDLATAGLVREALWEIGRLVVDDLDAIVNGLPPRRLQAAQPEFASRYVRTTQIPTESR